MIRTRHGSATLDEFLNIGAWVVCGVVIALGLLVIFGGSKASAQSAPGIGVDARGGAVIDPTKNVLDLVLAAVARQDDLRAANETLTKARIEGLEKLVALRAEYDARLQVAEAKRIDAIRAVDVNAVSVASREASSQATALATQVTQSAEVLRNQVATSAEALRALVATTAAATATTQQQQAAALSARITTLEQALSAGVGKSEGISATAGVALVLVTLLLTIIGIGIPVLLRMRQPANGTTRA